MVAKEHDAAVMALATHPNLLVSYCSEHIHTLTSLMSRPRLLIGGYSGSLKLWDYDRK